MKKLLCALTILLLLTSCAPQEADDPAPVEPPREEIHLYYLGSSASSLSGYLTDKLEGWAAEEGWTYTFYDCKGKAATQSVQVGDLARTEKPGVAVVSGVMTGEALDEAAERLYRAKFQVVTLGETPSEDFTRYVNRRLTVDSDQALAKTIELITQTVGDREAGYLCLSDFWPEFRENTMQEAFPEGYQRLDVQYTAGKEMYGHDFTLQSLADHPETNFVFAFNPVVALGAAQAVQEAGKWQQVPVFTGYGEQEAVEAVAGGRLAGCVAVSPAETWKLLQQAVKGGGARETVLPIQIVTEETAERIAGEYKR